MRPTWQTTISVLVAIHLTLPLRIDAQSVCATVPLYTGDSLALASVTDSIVDSVASRLRHWPIDVVIVVDSVGEPVPTHDLDRRVVGESLRTDYGNQLPLALLRIMLEERREAFAAMGTYIYLGLPWQLLERALVTSTGRHWGKVYPYVALSEMEARVAVADSVQRRLHAARIRFVCAVATTVVSAKEPGEDILGVFRTLQFNLRHEAEGGNEAAAELLRDPLLITARGRLENDGLRP